ncbi:MAG: efflux RND transporter periplasmic adaptor subunit [Phycisphaerales bacterium]|nr:efflux RND transporter periplasmic adaptor subunit [Phycisphaerales bacterium]
MKLKSVMGGACLAVAVVSGSAGRVMGEPPAPSAARSEAELDSLVRGFGGDKSVTRPGREAIMGFSTPTTIKEIAVKGGQRVKKGDLLVRGDDGEQVAIWKYTKLQAETDLPVQKALKTKELAELEWTKHQEMQKSGAGSPQEYDRARLTYESAVIDLDTAKLQQEQQVSALERADSLVERFRLRAPFDGVVDIVLYDEGHNVNEQDKVVKVVDVGVLWMDVPVPTQQTVQLGSKVGDPAWVLTEVPGGVRILSGKVIEVAPTGDSASRTRRVRVEISNADGSVIAGEPAWVRLSEPTAEWKARQQAMAGR